jgi:single-stranded DNA-binding protein
MSIVLRSGNGDAASTVQVAVFGDAAVALRRIEKNEKVYVESEIRVNEWTTDTGEHRGLSIAARRAERPGIG